MINKKILIIFLITLFTNTISCKQNSDKSLSISKKEKKNIVTQKLTCQEIVEKIIKSSNLYLKIYKNYFIDIDKIENDSISIHIYFENNLSDNPEEKQIVESTIAWLLLIPNKKKLYNVTVDPENPVELSFDKSILTYNDIFQACKISKENIYIRNDLKYKTTVLPFDFEDFYASCIYPSDEKKCNEDYPKYEYNKNSELFKIIGNKLYFSEYVYLPQVNDFKPIILFDNTSDIESYYLIIIKNEKIISNLLIGKMDGESIQDFSISKDYKITLYKRKDSKDIRKKIRNYIISKEGYIK